MDEKIKSCSPDSWEVEERERNFRPYSATPAPSAAIEDNSWLYASSASGTHLPVSCIACKGLGTQISPEDVCICPTCRGNGGDAKRNYPLTPEALAIGGR